MEKYIVISEKDYQKVLDSYLVATSDRPRVEVVEAEVSRSCGFTNREEVHTIDRIITIKKKI